VKSIWRVWGRALTKEKRALTVTRRYLDVQPVSPRQFVTAPAAQAIPVSRASTGTELGDDLGGWDALTTVQFGLAGPDGLVQAGAILVVQFVAVFDDGKRHLAAVGEIGRIVHEQPAAAHLPAEIQSHASKCMPGDPWVQWGGSAEMPGLLGAQTAERRTAMHGQR
jgi:hypothetical protein